MNPRVAIVSAFIAASAFSLTSNSALAYCGVIQESATAKTAERASQKARLEVRNEVRKLRRQHGPKLRTEKVSLACVGGGVAIDAMGDQLVGRPSCTATVSFCVNP